MAQNVTLKWTIAKLNLLSKLLVGKALSDRNILWNLMNLWCIIILCPEECKTSCFLFAHMILVLACCFFSPSNDTQQYYFTHTLFTPPLSWVFVQSSEKAGHLLISLTRPDS